MVARNGERSMSDIYVVQEDGYTFLSPEELEDYRTQQAQQYGQGGY